jgi:hypothetical protein
MTVKHMMPTEHRAGERSAGPDAPFHETFGAHVNGALINAVKLMKQKRGSGSREEEEVMKIKRRKMMKKALLLRFGVVKERGLVT